MKLEDKKLNKITDLGQNSIYVFSMNATDNSDRFVLHFNKDLNCNETVLSSPQMTFENEISIMPAQEGNLVNFNLTENTPVSMEVLNLLGQELVPLKKITANTETEKIILPSGYSGIYIVKISSEKGNVIRKFYR